jgi:predicted aspartyl protease
MPWAVEQTVLDSYKLDPCNPRTRLLYARLATLNSRYATARQQILLAHQFDPADPEIRSAWIATLPLKERVAEWESYLASPNGRDADEQRRAHLYLDHLNKLVSEPPKGCRLASTVMSTEIPFTKIMYNPDHMRALGLQVGLNHTTASLEIDTGAGGLTVSRTVAERAGLKSFSKSEAYGVGDKGPLASYTAYVDSIRIGDLEFKNCSVQVVDMKLGVDNDDGLIGMDVFSKFLVTLDYPMRKLLLGPLPPRPGEVAAPTPSLKTDRDDADDADLASDREQKENDAKPDDKSAASTAASAPATAAVVAAPKAAATGPWDRYVAPEMKDYVPVYRMGHLLLLPTGLNNEKIRLFALDTGAWTTTITPQAAREVSKIHADDHYQIRGISGAVDKVYVADEITFQFAHLSRKSVDAVAFDTSKISKGLGTEISGFLGADTLKLLVMHIDYRDGLVKFDYIPDRGYKF